MTTTWRIENTTLSSEQFQSPMKKKRRKRKNRYPNFPLPALCHIFLHGWSARDSTLNLGLTWKPCRNITIVNVFSFYLLYKIRSLNVFVEFCDNIYVCVVLLHSLTTVKPVYIEPPWTNICARNRRVFDLCSFNQQKIPALGLYLKFGLHRIPVYSRFFLDRFHCVT